MLWLALFLPTLPLAVLERGRYPSGALAVSDGQSLLAANAEAQAAGITPGLSPATALALLPTLEIRSRNASAERRALRQLAAWSLQFTPWVSLQPPAGLLLEVEGSLNLFKGLTSLCAQVRAGLDSLGYRAEFGLAPTPGGAWLLSRGGDPRPVRDDEQLRSQLAALPCTLLELEPRQLQALQGLGIDTLGQCLELPRAGLARRLGNDLLLHLDRALGTLPDPRRPYLPPRRFHSRLELPAAVTHSEPLLFGLRRLLLELEGYLRGLDAGIQQLTITLGSVDAPAQSLSLGLQAPGRDAERLLMLARERFAQTPLAAAVDTITIASDDILPFTPTATPLFENDSAKPTGYDLIERFHARLGEAAVRGLRAIPEHRPERAWDYSAPGKAQPDSPPTGPRPLWLLPQPQQLTEREGCPCWGGRLVLQQGPERIEGGWWDGADVRRDYYIAQNPGGERLWVFHELRPPRRWYLHGFFA